MVSEPGDLSPAPPQASGERTAREVEPAGRPGPELPTAAEEQMRAALDALRCHFPPDKAKPVNDQVRYRLVRSDPPTAADVVPHCLEPHFDRQRWRTGDPAEAVPYTGLSVLNTAARARKLRDGIPALRDRVVATGTLPEGLTLQVSSGHRVWWPKPSVTWFWEVDRDAVAGCFEVLADQG